MENLDDKKSDAAGVCDPGALSRPTDVTGAADVGAASLESGCGESFQSNFEIGLENLSDQERHFLSLFNKHVTTLATEYPEVYAQLLEAFLQEVFRMDTTLNLST